MLILVANRDKTEKVLRLATRCGWVLCCLVVFVFSLMMGLGQEKVPVGVREEKKIGKRMVPSLDLIGQGALSLNGFKQKNAFPDLSREIIVLAKNLRPGEKKTDVLFALRSSGQEYKAKIGEQLFLSCDALAGSPAPRYHFSQEQTPLWIKPTFVDQDKVLLEIGFFTSSEGSESFQEEKMQISLQEGGSNSRDKKNLPFVERLQKAKLWGQDAVLSRFVESKKKSMKDKVKLEISGENPVFCFVGKGDVLQWDGVNWIPLQSLDEGFERPLAQVKTVSSRSIELDVWDEEGFGFLPVKLDLQNMLKPGSQVSMQPQSIRMRSAKQVSCLFGKKRFLIKEGDWILKTSRGFRNLRRAADREDYLGHRLQGELFIFDALVKDQGKLVMKGFLIDEMRMYAQPFSSPVLGDNKAQMPTRSEKKHLFFEKSGGDAITYFPSSGQKEIAKGGPVDE